MPIYSDVCIWDLGQTIRTVEPALYFHLKLSSVKRSEKHPLMSVEDQACYRESTSICSASITCCPWESSAFLSFLGQYVLDPTQIFFFSVITEGIFLKSWEWKNKTLIINLSLLKYLTYNYAFLPHKHYYWVVFPVTLKAWQIHSTYENKGSL